MIHPPAGEYPLTADMTGLGKTEGSAAMRMKSRQKLRCSWSGKEQTVIDRHPLRKRNCSVINTPHLDHF